MRLQDQYFYSLLRPIIVGSLLVGICFAGLGIWLVNASIEFSFFGQTFKSTSAGAAAIFIGACTIVLILRRTLQSIDRASSGARANTPYDKVSKAISNLEQLCNQLDRMSHTQKVLFREILQADDRVASNAFASFFGVSNRIGGSGRGIYVMNLVERTGMVRSEVMYRCKDLQAAGLVEDIDLTDKLFRVVEPVVDIVNKHHSSILERLYTREERANAPVPEFHGGMKLENEKPYFFYDIDEKPLNGKFMFKNELFMQNGVYEFEDGKLIRRLD